MQDRHQGDRRRLFTAVRDSVGGETALYPGSFVDIAASMVYPEVTYVDIDRRTPGFFGDTDGLREILTAEVGPSDPRIDFHHADYRDDLDLDFESFDLLLSLYAGLVSDHCTDYLKIGGHLLVNPSHGDVAMASLDDRYDLVAVVKSRSGEYRVDASELEAYLKPKKPTSISRQMLRERQRGVGYTRTPFAYLFRRVA